LFSSEDGLYDSYDIFPASHKISSVRGMFFNCPKLHISSKSIKGFFDGLGTGRKQSTIQELNAQGVFYKCFNGEDTDNKEASTLRILPDGVFNSCTHLTNLDYAFAGTGLE
jgi:hypothetical protein